MFGYVERVVPRYSVPESVSWLWENLLAFYIVDCVLCILFYYSLGALYYLSAGLVFRFHELKNVEIGEDWVK